jgi:hypothetical protein
MKLRLAFCSTAVALALGAAPALAADAVIVETSPAPGAVIVETAPAPGAVIVETSPAPYVGERIYVPAVRPSGSIHGGAVTLADEQLLSDTVAAMASDRHITNSTVTIVAKNGELIMNGTAKDAQTAARMERIAQQVSGGRVTAFWGTQLG